MKLMVMIFIVTISLFITKYGRADFFTWQRHGSLNWAGNIFGPLSVDVSKQFPFILAMASVSNSKDTKINTVALPKPKFTGSMAVEETIKKRRTERSFVPIALSQQQLSQILWAAQGITEEGGFKRSIPSAGALYPLDIFTVVGKDGVDGIQAGVYHYQPAHHQMKCVIEGDLRKKLAEAAFGQMWISHAPIAIVITSEYERTTGKYDKRGIRYTHMEVGHAGQNIFLQAESLNLGAGIVGAFSDDRVKDVLNLPDEYVPLLIMPVGVSDS